MIGFEAEHYTLNEQHGSQQVTIEVLSSPSSLQTNVTMQVIALPGNATGAYNYYTAWETLCHNMILNVLIFFSSDSSDYSLPLSEVTLTASNPRVHFSLNIISDGVVLEGLEVFTLQLQRSEGQSVIDVRDAKISIIDTDGRNTVLMCLLSY